jgi:hypothetical protein
MGLFWQVPSFARVADFWARCEMAIFSGWASYQMNFEMFHNGVLWKKYVNSSFAFSQAIIVFPLLKFLCPLDIPLHH